MFSIRKSSTELNDVLEPQWHFPSALSPEAHAEWGIYKTRAKNGEKAFLLRVASVAERKCDL